MHVEKRWLPKKKDTHVLFLQACFGLLKFENSCPHPGGGTTILHLLLCMEIAMKHISG